MSICKNRSEDIHNVVSQGLMFHIHALEAGVCLEGGKLSHNAFYLKMKVQKQEPNLWKCFKEIVKEIYKDVRKNVQVQFLKNV